MAHPLVAGAGRLLVVLAVLSVSGPAFAGVTLSKFPPNPGVMPGGGWQWPGGSNFADPPPPRSWTNGTYGGVPGSALKQNVNVPSPAGGNLPVTVARSASKAAIGRAAALAVRAIPLVGTVAVGVELWDMWDEIRVRPDGNGGLGWDEGTGEVQESAYCTDSFVPAQGQLCAESVAAVVGGAVSQYNAWQVGVFENCPRTGSWSCTQTTLRVGSPTGASFQIERQTFNENHLGDETTSAWAFWTTKGATYTSVTQCPASTDFSDPAFNIPAGAAPGPDGLCRTGHYDHGLTDDEASAKLWSHSGFKDDPGAVGEQVIESGGEIEGEPAGVEGPANQEGQGTTTTTTTSTGTKTVTTTPTYNYTYGGDNVTWNITNTTITINEDGSTVTETENPPAPVDPSVDPENPCTQNPESLGCIKLGEAPGDQVPKTTKTVDFTPEVLGLAEGCPAPVPLPNGQEISYQTTCDGLVTARPLIVAMGFLMAGGIIIAAIRGKS